MRGLTASIGQNSMLGIKWLVFLLLFVSLFWAVGNVRAQDFSWTSSPPSVAKKVAATTEPWNCEFPQKVTVAGDTALQNTCITSGGSLRFGMTDYGMPVVSLGYDQKMYKLLGFCSGYKNCMYLPHTDTLVAMQTHNSAYHRVLKVYKNFSYNLQKRTNDLGTAIEYVPKTYQANYTFTESLANPVPIGWAYDSFGVSENEKWLVFEPRNRGMFRLDLETFSIKRFSSHSYSYNSGSVTPWTHFSVSNDGQQVVMSGYNTDIMAFSIPDECGDSPTDQQIDDIQYLANECPKTYLRPVMSESITGFKYGVNAEFSQDQEGELRVYAVGQYPSDNAWVTLRAAGYQPTQSQLDYLALGDSYSSGEGDTALTQNGEKYYLAGTDVNGDYTRDIPREKCHQSMRAWPFLLADHYDIPVGDRFETVACSGAQIYDINIENSLGYEGQGRGDALIMWSDGGRPRLKDIDNKESFKGQALNEFIPGRQKQIEFVKKHKPKAITATVGGNDVNFGSRLGSCAMFANFTCDTANEEGRKKLGSDIKKQFTKLSTLYTELQNQSLGAKIYVVGYPQIIIDSDDAQCPLSTYGLSVDERKVMVAGYWYMNQVMKTAAQKAGVQYVDISDALVGHRLCESNSPHANGLIAGTGSKDERQESFHPNAKGNSAIADSIFATLGGQSLLDYDQYPTGPNDDIDENDIPESEYLQTSLSDESIVERTSITNQTVVKGSSQNILTKPLTLNPLSTAQVTLYSNPIDLGQFTVGENGSLDVDAYIPNSMPVGYHTLVVVGETYSGEPIELTQTILVTSDNPDDLDENNIPDTTQPCGPFLEAVGVDEDYDGIDDACDPEIEDVQPYRVRNGSEDKNENPNHIYIERNINATSVTIVSGDSDPDEDGWAVVAQSTTDKNSGTPAHFWIDDNKVPHVSIRTSYNGCVQFTPKSLNVVKPNKLRKLKFEAKNTNTCRSEPDSADTDNDQTPDNQQPLYRARNGLTTNNEDPTSIYLERSSVAAEAQLGLSDYLHSNSWNILAASKPDTTKEIFVKMVMITNQDNTPIPTILANQIKTNPKGKTTTTCIALQPQNTTTITTNNQHRTLKKVTIPEGEGCE